MIRTSLTIALTMTSLTLPAMAENVLTPLPAPEARPYPYEILGLQPGDPLDNILSVVAARRAAATTRYFHYNKRGAAS